MSKVQSRTLKVTVAALAVTVLLVVTIAAVTRPATYAVFAVRFGTVPDFPVRGLVAGADSTRRLDIAMMVWVLVDYASDRRVLVDAGFYRDSLVQRWRVRDFVRPNYALARWGIDRERVTDIIITHMHWDHAGGVDLFPNARVWIQKEEFEYYSTGEGRGRGGVDPRDVAILTELQNQGRLNLIDGDAKEIIPGLTVYTGGRHTYASQYVGVSMSAGTAVIASDNLYLYENLEKRVPIAQTLDAASNLRAQERMLQIASEPRLIVPGHDPQIFTRFGGLNAAHGLAQIK
jgi:glyoxylase-like metal-dependent hydrolase (beta-lactamase superfamily II)